MRKARQTARIKIYKVFSVLSINPRRIWTRFFRRIFKESR
jgi:hypothetical protein